MTADAHIDAAREAIAAAIRRAGPTMEVEELISAILALFATQRGMEDPVAKWRAFDRCSTRLVILVVQMVGARRARELVDSAGAVGAGGSIS